MSSLQPAQQHDASDDEERVERQLLPESAHALLQRSLWALFVLHHPKYTPKLRVLSNSYYYPLGGGDEDCVCVRERERERGGWDTWRKLSLFRFSLNPTAAESSRTSNLVSLLATELQQFSSFDKYRVWVFSGDQVQHTLGCGYPPMKNIWEQNCLKSWKRMYPLYSTCTELQQGRLGNGWVRVWELVVFFLLSFLLVLSGRWGKRCGKVLVRKKDPTIPNHYSNTPCNNRPCDAKRKKMRSSGQYIMLTSHNTTVWVKIVSWTLYRTDLPVSAADKCTHEGNVL